MLESDNPTGYISEERMNIYDDLCKGENQIFHQMTHLFTLCASIGHQNRKRVEIKKRHGIFKWVNLASETDITVLTAIAWDTRERDLAVLADKKTIIDIAGEFAEGGMQYLHEHFFADHLDKNGHIHRPEKLDIEFNLALIVGELRREGRVF